MRGAIPPLPYMPSWRGACPCGVRLNDITSSYHVKWVGPLSPWPCRRWRRRPPDMESSCEYAPYAVVDSRQRVVSDFWVVYGSNNPSLLNKE